MSWSAYQGRSGSASARILEVRKVSRSVRVEGVRVVVRESRVLVLERRSNWVE
jgi:hypothetical protein